MQLALVTPARIECEWERFSPLLAAALRPDPTGKTLESLRDDLAAGRFQLIEGVGDEATGILAFHLFSERGQLCCFASYLAGEVHGGPRKMIAVMRTLMSAFEEAVRAAGVTEIYIGGRDWGRIFPEFEPVDGVKNRRRKVLR